jgi:predicted transcriptional regulator
MKAAHWIDRLKEARGWPTDYKAAKELGISRRTVSNYRQYPDRTMDDDTAVRVAAALRERAEVVVLDQVRERAKSDLVRQVLGDALERLQRQPPDDKLALRTTTTARRPRSDVSQARGRPSLAMRAAV